MTAPTALNVEGRHPGTAHFAPFFEYSHLADEARMAVSAAACDLAQIWIDNIPDGPELTVGLRKLLEAKDCAVRAIITAQNAQQAGRLAEQQAQHNTAGYTGTQR